MKGFNIAFAARVGTSPWTCRQCRGPGLAQRFYSNGRAYGNARPPRRGRVLAAGMAGGLGVTALAFGDDVKHAYQAVERSSRVISTLAVCINE